MNYKQIRQSANLSITAMASYLGVDPRTVRRYEDGTRTPGGPVDKLYGILKNDLTAFPIVKHYSNAELTQIMEEVCKNPKAAFVTPPPKATE